MESGKKISGGRIKRAISPGGGRRGWTVFGAVLVLLLLAGAGAGVSWSKGKAASKTAFDPAKHFTIEKIAPDAAKEEIRIFFSQPLPLGFLRQHLRLLPRSKVNWNRSSINAKGVLTLRGKFVYGTTYAVALPGDQKVGKRTYRPTTISFKMPDRPPKVQFLGKKSVIELDSHQLLHVRTQNVGSLLLEEVKLPPALLPLALATKKEPESWAPQLEVLKKAAAQAQKLVQSQKGLAPFWGKLLEQKQLFAAPAAKNKVQAVSLPLTFRQDPKKGLMSLIRVINPQNPKIGTGPRVFRVTNLGLTYKLGQGSLLLWVTSLKTAAPLAGAQVAAISSDLEIFPLGATDKDGILIWQNRNLEGISLKQLGEFAPVKRRVTRKSLRFLLVAAKGDVSYIELRPHGDLKPVGVWQATGKEQARTLTGEVFTERGVYRPGEHVFYKGTIREYAAGKIIPPAGNPVLFEVRNPKGDQVYSRSLKLSEFGSAAGAIKVKPQWPLGTYTLTLKFGNKALPKEAKKARPDTSGDEVLQAAQRRRNTTEVTFQVQEFKPPRHFASVSFQRFTKKVKNQNQKEVPRQFVRIKISGSYYAGGPVKNGQVRWKIYHTKTSFQVPGQDDFTFGCAGQEKGELLEGGQAVLDQKGSVALEFPLDRQVLSGENGLLVLATVVDFDGRAATATKTMQVKPDYLVGISVHPERVKAHLNQVLRLRLAKPDGKLLQNGNIKVEILAQRWGYVAKLNEQGNVFWQDQEVWRHSGDAHLKLKQGQATYRFDFSQGGRYRLAFSYQDEKGRRFTSSTFYNVMGDIYWDAESRKQKPFQTLALAADQKAYKPGQTARLTISPPRPVARYLMTVEQNGILQYRVLTAKQGLQVLKLPIQAKYAPNVYVSVLGLTPRGDFPVLPGRYDSEAPSFYWGNLNLPVRLEVEPLVVKISPGTKNLKAEPGAKVELNFLAQTPDGKGVQAELAVAVVDEAVLALTGFKTPTLDKLVRFDQPLGVYTGEMRAMLVHQTPFYLARSESLTGGGGMNEAALAQLRRRFEAVAYFNPAVHTDAAGKAKVSFTLPDNMTTYRVYVVAQNKGSRFASPERPLLATKDFYLEPGMPGFFTKGDRFQFLVAAFNQSPAAGPVKFSASATGGLSLKAVKSGVNLPAKDSIKLPVAGEAKTPGPATAKFTGEFRQKTDGVELPVKINSGYIRETTVTLGSFRGKKALKVPLPSYLTADAGKKVGVQEVKAYLTLSGSPFVKMSRAIQYMLHYPYGCVEQTSSGVLALASLRGLVKAGQVSGVSLEEVDKYLQKGVARLLHLQLGNGGFPYWPGQPRAHPWGSVYATAALLQAKAQGLPVSKGVLNNACNYLRATIRKQIGTPSFGPFVIYLLSLNKSLDRSTFNLVSRDYKRLPKEGRLLTILAAKLSGYKSAKDLVPALKPLLEGKPGAAGPQDEFMARYRTPALALLAAQAVMPQNPLTAKTAAALLGGMGAQGIWTSTSDTGWALLALGQHFKKAKFKGEPGKVKVSQPQGPNFELMLNPKRPQTLRLDAAALLKKPVVHLAGQSGRSWMYQLELIFPRLDLAPEGAAHGFKVTRTIANTDGSKEIRVGDLVKVTLRLEPTTSTTSYVVIDDPLPAGLVAVNPVFQTEEPTPGSEDRFDYFSPDGLMRFRPNHLEMREDRVLAFRNWVYAGPQVFEYYARAVCQGTFVVPATKVSAMYAPLTYGCTPKSKITIMGRP